MVTWEGCHLVDLDNDGDSDKDERATDSQMENHFELMNPVRVVSLLSDFSIEEAMFSVRTTRDMIRRLIMK